MVEQSNDKWYSSGLTQEDAQKTKKRYATIKEPVFGLDDADKLKLSFNLQCENFNSTSYSFSDPKDIRELLIRTNARKIPCLEGKIIEIYVDRNLVKGLSVNPNLV